MNRFDVLAATWDDDPAKVSRAQAAADSLRAAIPLTGSRWRGLELGSGTGLLSRALAGDLGPITLVDTSEQMTIVAAEKVSAATEFHVTAYCLDLTEETPDNGPYDVAYSLLALHHIPDVTSVLSTLRELLVPGGWVAVLDLDHDEDGSFHLARHIAGHDTADRVAPHHRGDHAGGDGRIEHEHDGFSAPTLETFLAGAGFVDIDVTDAGFAVERGEQPRSYPMLRAVGRRPG